MPTIRQPRNPRVSGETVGPNSPDTVNPNLDSPYRDPGGDVGGPGRVTGRADKEKPILYRYFPG